MENILESKVSRTELLDVLIHELTQDLCAQRDAMRETVRGLGSFAWDEVSHLFTDGCKAVVELSRLRQYETKEEQVQVCVTLTLPAASSKIGASLRAHLRDLDQAEKDKLEVEQQLHRIHGERGALKVRLLRQMLSQSEEGKRLLGLMDEMKKSARRQLSLSAKR